MVAFAWQVMIWLDDGRRAGDLWWLHGEVTKDPLIEWWLHGEVTKDPLIELQQYIKWRN